MFPIEIVREN